MPHIEFTPSTTPDDSVFNETEMCSHCVAAHESLAAAREVLKIFTRRRNIRGKDLRTLARAASDLIHNISGFSYPSKDECTCSSLS